MERDEKLLVVQVRPKPRGAATQKGPPAPTGSPRPSLARELDLGAEHRKAPHFTRCASPAALHPPRLEEPPPRRVLPRKAKIDTAVRSPPLLAPADGQGRRPATNVGAATSKTPFVREWLADWFVR